MKLLTIILAASINILPTYPQETGKRYIDTWILNTFPESVVDNKTVYILNGYVIASDSIDFVLNKYKPEDFAVINYIDQATTEKALIEKQPSGIILLVTIDQQSKKSIQIDFQKAKKRFSEIKLKTTADIDTGKKEPVLIINGKQIFHSDCFEEINRLRINQIKSINYIQKPVSQNIYGQNAINGLIVITRK
jgi:hypothetical protein